LLARAGVRVRVCATACLLLAEPLAAIIAQQECGKKGSGMNRSPFSLL
jgi:hypothetical protein